MFNAARWSKPFLVASSILLIFSSLTRSTALAQEGFSSTTQDGALSEAPQPAQDTTQSGANDSRLTGTGSLSGTVLDTNRDVLQGARVTLAGRAGGAIQTVESGSNGQFAFTGLPPDVYKLTVTAAAMNTFTSTQIPLHAGEARIVPGGNSLGCWWDHQCDRDCRKQGGTG
jgi:Carboxypeptidase regulatory-like domain